MCADQPAVREHANIAGASSGGTPATSSTTDAQYSTRVHRLLIQLPAPLEDEALGGGLSLEHLVARHRRCVRSARRLGDDRERRRREPAEILLRLLVVDVDELAELPLAAERGKARLEV